MLCLFHITDCSDSRCHPYSKCDETTNVCTCQPLLEVYSPVCGSDLKTYQSIYDLNHTSCTEDREITKLYSGNCKCMV